MNLSTSDFSYHKDIRCFTAEVSTLSDKIGPGVPQVIFLESHKTRKIMHFDMVERITDRDGDVQGWGYAVSPKNCPADIMDLKITIFND